MSIGGTLVQSLVGQAVSSAFGELDSILDLIPQGMIDSISITATLEEVLTDTLQVTKHPVEQGAQISDHSYVANPTVVMRCGWSNAGGGILSSVNALLSGSAFTEDYSSETAISGSTMSVGDYVSGVYSQLLALQQGGTVFDIVTSIRQYTNMVITSLALTRDKKTSQSLMVTITAEQIRIVSTSSTKLPSLTNQASTTQVNNVGDQNLQPAAIATGGSGGDDIGQTGDGS